MILWMKEFFKRIKRSQIQAFGTAMFMTYSFSAMDFSIPNILYDDFHPCKTTWITHKARCMQTSSSKEKENSDHEKTNLLSTEPPRDRDNRSSEIQDAECIDKKRSQNHSPYDNEFKIILLGATGSGKSQLGNVLLQKVDTKEGGFETSCYAKSKTKKSILKSVTKTVKRNNVSKTYKIDIIDTPAISDTGLEYQEVEQEIEKAKLLSVPGPHAFLMCIPATAVTNYFTDDYALYEKHFRGRLRNSTIIVFTRCDQYESENNQAFDSKRVMGQNSFLKKMNNQISIDSDNSKTLEEVIDIIIKIEKQNMWFWRFRSWF